MRTCYRTNADGTVTPGGDNVTILYTIAEPTQGTIADMRDPASTAYNGPTGSTGWCSLDQNTGAFTLVSGVGACPAPAVRAGDGFWIAEDVTGIRILRPGEFAANSVLRVRLRTNAEGNNGGNIMDNAVVMRAAGINVPIGARELTVFEDREVPPNTGQISGRVWDDLDSDGVWDAGEPPIAGARVQLFNHDGSPAKNDAGDDLIVTTDATGRYLLVGVYASPHIDPTADYNSPRYPYTLKFVTPDGYAPTLEGVLRPDGQPYSVGLETQVTLDPQHQYVDYIDSGFRRADDLTMTKAVTGMTGPDGKARVGDLLTYTVTATNPSTNRVFTDYFPARFIDDLSGVLDHGVVMGTPTATVDGVKPTR